LLQVIKGLLALLFEVGLIQVDIAVYVSAMLALAWFYRVQALILSPTRELAEQTERVITVIGENINIQVHACIGGKSVGEDIRKLEHGVHVVSGTPGRVCDMIKRRSLRTRAIRVLVLVSLMISSLKCQFALHLFALLCMVIRALRDYWLNCVLIFVCRMNLMRCWAEGSRIKSMTCTDISHPSFRCVLSPYFCNILIFLC
jgi:hypothetical protein